MFQIIGGLTIACVGRISLRIVRDEDRSGAFAPLFGVEMRVLLIRQQRACSVCDGLGRDVRVEVVSDYQRQVRSDLLSHAADDFVVGVRDVLGDHGAMQCEVDAVVRTACCEIREQAIDQIFEGASATGPLGVAVAAKTGTGI